MALVVYDRVQETTATTGTGSVTLGGAVAGYQSFAVVGNGNTTFYCLVNGTQWEVGIGTYSTTGPTLARTTVLSNSNGNTSPITLSGGSQVFITYPSEKSVNQDANGNVNANSFIPGWASTTTAAGTTTLTTTSTYYQRFIGSTTQTVQLPNATTVNLGQGFIIDNDSTGALALQDATPTSLGSVVPGMAAFIFCENNSTAAGSWSGYLFVPGGGPSGQVTWGTAGLVMGNQTISGVNTISMAGQLTNTVATGTAPFVVSSTTQVANLNAATAGTAGNVTGIVAVANGGTGLTTLTANYIPYGNGTGAFSSSANLTFNGNTLSCGTSGGSPNANNSFEAYGTQYLAQRNSSATSSGGGIWAQDVGFWSTPTYSGTGIQYFGASATGTTLGISNASLSSIVFQNCTNALIYTNGGTPLIFGTTSAERMRITSAGGVSFGSSGTAYGTTGQALISQGNATPIWGTLGVAGGGTGVATLTGVAYGNGTSAFTAATAAQLTSAMGVASTSTNGYLSSTDWNTFNNKQPAGSYLTTAVTSLSFGTTGLTPSSATTGAITVAGTLVVGNGGTGATTFTANGILYGNGTSAVGVTAAGTTGQVLTATTGSAPTWASPAASGATITGTTTSATYYVVGTTSTSGTLSTASISNTNAVSYNASTGALTAVSMVSSSDERLKTNWEDLPVDFIENLAKVKHGSFTRISSGNKEVGVSAQSLQPVLDKAVIQGEDGLLTVNYGGAALVAAIELAKEVKALRAEIAALKAK